MDAEDLVSDTNLKILANIKSYKYDKAPSDNEFAAWSCTILHNIFIDGIRRSSKKNYVGHEHAKDEFDDKAMIEYFHEENKHVKDVFIKMMSAEIKRLPSKNMRTVLLMRKLGCSLIHISEHLDMEVNAIKSIIHRGKEIIHNKLKIKIDKYFD